MIQLGLTLLLKCQSCHKCKCCSCIIQVGEIGWDVSSVREDHVKLWRSGHQIKVCLAYLIIKYIKF